MSFRDGDTSVSPARYGIVGGRVARMSALERAGEDEPHEYEDSPESGLRVPPKRSGSLSSGSHLGAIAAAGMEDESSPQTNSNGEYSSPEGVGSGQSEQLTFFKDYYSQDEIRPGDKVAVLWAYQPRANDEFELERGDMLKVVGIWDDGWATGVRLIESAEDYEDDRHNPQRDSGMSNGSSRSSPTNGEIKAFPVSHLPPLFFHYLEDMADLPSLFASAYHSIGEKQLRGNLQRAWEDLATTEYPRVRDGSLDRKRLWIQYLSSAHQWLMHHGDFTIFERPFPFSRPRFLD
ncbi:MAG: hypothetical protein Q9157_004845 [Trypethelium eluteriae]